MRMIPTHCLACGRLALRPDAAIAPDGLSACECGAAAHTVPGPTYAASDVPLFDAIAYSLRSAGVNWLNAKHLSIGLQTCASPRPVMKLQELAHQCGQSWWPAGAHARATARPDAAPRGIRALG
jgi:hypothetical protein